MDPRNLTRRSVWTRALVLGAFLFTACASAGTTFPRGDRDVISLEELEGQTEGDVYDAIRRLRPRWLQNRGVSSTRQSAPSSPQVYLDGAPMGSIRALRTINVMDAQRVEYMNASDATTRFGTGHDGGAILVITRSGGF